MPTIFPLNPTLNQKHTSGNVSWKWNGQVWELSMDKQPAPFYMHTHSYDGDVHTIDIQETINFTYDINNVESVDETIPVIIGLDGGDPDSVYSDPSFANLTLLDGGQVGN
jgi:hypothetical protein